MKYTEIDKFVKENKLLEEVEEKSGIYAITIDGYIVYIGKSVNIRDRCKQHIYKTQNAMLIKEKKYLLLLAAKLGGHNIDCIPIKYVEAEQLDKYEVMYIKSLVPQLNIQHNHRIDDLLIEQVINGLRYKVIRKNNTYILDTEEMELIATWDKFDTNNSELLEEFEEIYDTLEDYLNE